MAAARMRWTILLMSTPTVTEIRRQLEPVTADPFVADLGGPSCETQARLDDLVERLAAAPPRRKSN
jgi:hypothetical protein